MTFPLWFVYWVLAFLAVIALLSVGAAIQEWRLWRREHHSPGSGSTEEANSAFSGAFRMSMQGYYDQVTYSDISASQSGFKLLGGTYGITVTATWGGGSVDLKKLSADGSTYVSVLSSTFTANAFQTVSVPPGTYQLTVTTATAVYADITSVISAAGP